MRKVKTGSFKTPKPAPKRQPPAGNLSGFLISCRHSSQAPAKR
jgi:hypothetical protein